MGPRPGPQERPQCQPSIGSVYGIRSFFMISDDSGATGVTGAAGLTVRRGPAQLDRPITRTSE
eukprot:41714-Hanusia_phi.AAC.1